MRILSSNVDLGGILLYEKYNGEAMDLAREIHACRPELPTSEMTPRPTQASCST